MMASRTSPNQPVAERARKRILRRIVPYIFFLYVIAFLDRVNIGYAALEMTKDLGFTAEVYGFGAGIFFVGYFLLEIPGTLIVEHWSARLWIGRIMISWGLLAMIMGFIRTPTQFYLVRFLLGAAEAGFFPGIIVYLSHWFRYEDRAKTVALFMAAIPISNIIGSPVSGLLLGMNWFGITGWRWLFILEGAPAVIFGVVTVFYLTDWPRQARWLPSDECEWITSELEKEKELKLKAHSFRVFEAFRQREVVLLTLGYFLAVTGGYGLTFWLPTLIKKASGSSNLVVSLISTIPYLAGLFAMVLVGWSSDRLGERRWHTAVPLGVGFVGLLLSALVLDSPAVAVAMLCLAAAGLYGYLPPFWSLPTKFLSGSAAAATIGMINSVGNLGGFVGPYVVGYVNTATGSFFFGILYLSLSTLLGAAAILRLRHGRQRGVAVATVTQPTV
jgi:ACS family tartrate transporter-like MFS transporter